MIIFRDKSTRYEEPLKRIGLLSLRVQRLAKILSTVVKILVSDTGTPSLREFLTVRPAPLIISGEEPSKSEINNLGLRILEIHCIEILEFHSRRVSENSNLYSIL